MVTYQELKSLKPEDLRAVGLEWSRLSRRLEKRGDALHAGANCLADHWGGDAHDTAAQRLSSLAKEIDATAAPLISIDTELSALADNLRKAQGMLHDAEADARRIPAVISSDGSEITYIGDDFRPHMRKTIETRIQKVFNGIDAALNKASQADRAAAKTLAKLVPGFNPATHDNGHVPKADVPKPGTNPREVKDWWDSLTSGQRQYLIYGHPDKIGRLDGVPVIARDQANRVRLAREHDKAAARKKHIEARLRELETIMRGGSSSQAARANLEAHLLLRELDVVDRGIRGMKAIETRLYHPDAGYPRAYLVKFEPGTVEDRRNDGVADDDGRVIIAVGNPDTANHVATYVPGTGSELSKVGTDVGRADILTRDSREMPGGKDTAVVLWVDFNAPDEVFPSAASSHYAETATEDLRRFQNGLRATHEGAGSHNTLIGYSYGSTVIGYTARDGATHADDLVFVGSPGLGVGNADGLGMPTDHVWATRAKHDIIKRVPDIWFGTDPTHELFGGRTFDSEDGDADDEKGTHSRYWHDRQARKGMAGIITGNFHSVPGYAASTPPDHPARPSPGPDSAPGHVNPPTPGRPAPPPSPRPAPALSR